MQLNRTKKSQAFSMDIMLAIVIFLGAIFITYLMLQGGKGGTAKQLEQDASTVLDNLASSDNELGIVDGVEINETKIQQLIDSTYPELKQKMRAGNDFCIFLEDDQGDIIYISNQAGIGSGKIKISDTPCE